MIIAVLLVLGLCLGSFVNALTYRLYEQAKKTKNKQLSILKGRSLCPHCKHTLAAQDLIPVISWLSLRGKCRYCHRPISWQYPLVELITAGLFMASYLFWPMTFDTQGSLMFASWLILLTGFVALMVYDLKWFLLPSRIIYALGGVVGLQVLIISVFFDGGFSVIGESLLGALCLGGFFYLLFQISKGKWIGGGDVRLGTLLGLLVGGPVTALLLLFIASTLGTFVALPLLLTGKMGRSSRLPFGPFLIVAAIIVQLFGASIIDWYEHALLLY